MADAIEGETTTEVTSAEEAPVEEPAPAEEGEEPPAEGEDPPAEGEDPPAEGEDPPAEGEDPPAEGEDPPAEGEDPPAEGEDPGDGDGATRACPATGRLRLRFPTIRVTTTTLRRPRPGTTPGTRRLRTTCP